MNRPKHIDFYTLTTRLRSVLLVLMGVWMVHAQILPPDFFTLQGGAGGSSTFAGLSLAHSAQALIGGQAGSGGALNATDVPTFSANTALLGSNHFSINHLEYLLGLRNDYLGACFPIVDVGTVGWFSQVFTTGRWDDARDIYEQPNSPVAFDFAMGLSFARAFAANMVAIGINGRYAESHLDEAVARTVSAGFDLRLAPAPWISGHLYGTNFGPPVRYTTTAEPQPLTMGGSLQLRPLRHLVALTDKVDVDLSAGALKRSDEPLRLGASLQTTIINHIIPRIGYEYTWQSKPTVQGAGAGIGISIDNYGLDFGWKNLSTDLGSIWSLALHYHGKPIEQRSALEFYRVAEAKFRAKHYGRAIRFATEALQRDPNLWQAHTLISRAQAEMRRRKGLEVALFIAGNTQANFIPAPAQQGGLGGLAREAALLRTLKKQFPQSFTLHSGNMVKPTSHPAKAMLAGAYFRTLRFDALTTGSGEVGFGLQRYVEQGHLGVQPLIGTNSERQIGDNLVTHKSIERGRYRFAVLSVVAPRQELDSAQKLTEAVAAVREQLRSTAVGRADVRILVIDADWGQIQQYARALSRVEIIVCNNLTQRFETPMRVDSSWVFSTGAGGGHLSAVTFQFDPTHRLEEVRHKLYPLGEQIVPDSQVAEMVRSTTMQIELANAGIDRDKLIRGELDGVFVFVSDRDGGSHIFLKVMQQQAEFALTSGDIFCSAPMLSRPAARILYMRRNAPGGAAQLWTMNCAGGEKRQVNSEGGVDDAVFSPDGRWIYFTRVNADKTTDIMRVSAQGTVAEPVIAWAGSSEKNPTLSAKGGLMAFASNREGKFHIYLSDGQGSDALRLANLEAHHSTPRFSPDGAFLAYLSDRQGFAGKADVWLYNRTSGRQTQLTRNAHVLDYCWLDDSRTLVYSAGINLADYNAVDIVGGTMRKFLPLDTIKTYSERDAQLVADTTGERHVIYTRHYPTGKKEIHMVRQDGSKDRRVVNGITEDWLD
jgi:hypothetical protein